MTNVLALTFLAPSRLWLLVAVLGLLAGYAAVQVRRRAYAVRFTNLELLRSVAPRSPGWRRHLPALAMLLGLASLVLALARPAREERVPRERATVILAIDTSLSMQATDVAPSRLRAAQRAAKAFLRVIPPKINVGLVAFNGSAQVLATPTIDRAVVATAIDNLELAERTAIGEGIFASLQAIKQAPKPRVAGEKVPSRIVLMSDGETTSGRPDSVGIDAARQAKVPVTTIAFGTDNGYILLPDNPNPVPVRVNRAALQRIADETRGRAFTAESAAEISTVFKDIGSSVGYVTEFREIGLWFVGAATALLFLSAAMSLLWTSRLP
ncbi:MAG: VWA domain-containing protein [Actinobacteria bacterium]|nr:VWA domain-containing protein [Actinomycetota bacterium]